MIKNRPKLLALVGSLSVLGVSFFSAESAFAAVEKVTIENKELYDALKFCAEVTPTYDDPQQYKDENFQNAIICPGLEKAEFSDATQTISFATTEDYRAVTEIYLNNMGLKNVDELEKFENAGRIYVLNNEIEEVNFLSELLYGGPRNRQIYISGNRLRKYPGYYDYSRVFNEDNAYADLFGMIITLHAMVVTNQTVEDEYEGDSYEMPDFIAKVQANFDFISNPPAFSNDGDTQMAQAIGAYYNSDRWLTLENATLGNDRKSLVPIDKTKDMKISYCTTFEDTANSPLFAGMTTDALSTLTDELKKYHGDDGEACILKATIKSKNTATPATLASVEVPGVPNTSANANSLKSSDKSGATQNLYISLLPGAILAFLAAIRLSIKVKKQLK